VKKVVAKKNSVAVKAILKAVRKGAKAPKAVPDNLAQRIQLSYTFLGPGKIFDPRVNLGRGGVPAHGPIMGPPTPPKDIGRVLRWMPVETIEWPTGEFAVEIGIRFVPKSRLG
jgi:hypothetical protein